MKPICLPLLSLLTLLSSCFTGVESTPKITSGDVRKENIVVTPEDTFLISVADAPLPCWEEGKRFVVTDDKIKLLFGHTAPASETLAGKIITYDGAAEATSITGGKVTDLIFHSPAGMRMAYRVNQPLSELAQKSSLSVPFTVQESMVEEARHLLEGKNLYILTRSWRNDEDNSVHGRQFVPVTIDSVTPGNTVYPIKIAFTDSQGTSARIFLYPGAKGSTPRTFSSLFSFSDPRKKYPGITDENWQHIIDGHVALDMTRDECRLSLGAPKDVDRAAGPSYLREVWLYENGIYLVFEDGLLRHFRK